MWRSSSAREGQGREIRRDRVGRVVAEDQHAQLDRALDPLHGERQDCFVAEAQLWRTCRGSSGKERLRRGWTCHRGSGNAAIRPRPLSRSMAATSTTTRPNEGIATAFLALCLGAVAMGISPIFVRFAAADVGPYASAFWRVALALPVLYAWMRLDERRRAAPARARSFTVPTLLAGLAFAGDLFFWHLSILATTVANATFFATTAPVFVVLITWLVLRRAAGGTGDAGRARRSAFSGGSPSSGRASRSIRRAFAATSTASRRPSSSAFTSSPSAGRGTAARAPGPRHLRGSASSRRPCSSASPSPSRRPDLAVDFWRLARALRHGLDQPRGRAGPALGGARAIAAGVLVPRDLPGGDRGRVVRLGAPRRAGDGDPDARRRARSSSASGSRDRAGAGIREGRCGVVPSLDWRVGRAEPCAARPFDATLQRAASGVLMRRHCSPTTTSPVSSRIWKISLPRPIRTNIHDCRTILIA